MNLVLDSITVEGFRGVPTEQTYNFRGKNAVFQGPNGSGKSTALQAIEFLLTGEIQALRGSGTGGITAPKHIPNLQVDPKDTVVRGTFKDAKGTFQVYRRFTNRSKIVAERRPPVFSELVTLANSGLLHLTREEILELILTTPGNRKEQIYQLINTGQLDDRRLRLKGVQRKASQAVDHASKSAQDSLDRLDGIAKGSVSLAEGRNEQTLDTDALLTEVNDRRKRLNAPPLTTLPTNQSFTVDVDSPVEQASHPLQRTDICQDIDTLQSWVATISDHQMTLDHTRRAASALQADTEALASLSELSLIQQGRQFVDAETTSCPLCDSNWNSEELSRQLQNKTERLERIEQRRDELITQTNKLHSTASTPIQPIQRLLKIADTVDDIDWTPIRQFAGVLQAIVGQAEKDIIGEIETFKIERLNVDLESFAPTDVLNQLEAKANQFPDQAELQQTWDELTTLEEGYSTWRAATKEIRNYETVEREITVSKEEYIAARDEILGDIFEAVSKQFEELYSLVNPDETSFDPKLGQTNTGVKFDVGFYDEGRHPPRALHSEGHQDLMGVALFLSLVSQFSPLDRTPVLLDDVLMSVDATHRKRIAEILASELSHQFQFIITTHDEIWAKQLCDANAVPAENKIMISEWTPSGGPELEGNEQSL